MKKNKYEELEKWKKINSAQTVEDLKEAIFNIAEKGIIKGSCKDLKASDQVLFVQVIYDNYSYDNLNLLTRSYGIRQQMMYLLHYKDK